MNPFMTSFPDDADVSKIMLLSLEKGEIDILHLPKQYERSEKKKNKSPLSYPRRLRQRGRGPAMRGYIGKGKASLLSQPPVFNPEATSRPSAGRAHSRTVTGRRSSLQLPADGPAPTHP